ncbi:MAG: hypothetical protein R3183_09715 [Oleiphilaceae bacterium]|nr:hypothetical protein [Oleiphilaceae bacterium]
MRFGAIVTTLILSATALSPLSEQARAETTRVYKTVHPDGSVSYSDQPSKKAQAMDVQPVETVPAFKAPASSSSRSQPSVTSPAQEYTQLTILNPSHDSAFWAGDGKVDITLEAQPGLRPKHQFRILLDGNARLQTQKTQISLTNIDRGIHQLTVEIIDENGETLKRAQNTFTLHRPSLRN